MTRYKADGADFLDGVPKQLLPDLYYLGDFGGQAVYVFFAASRCFLVDAAGGTGLFEFVKTRLRQLGREPARPTVVLLTSGGAEVRAGIEELVEKGQAQIVAAPATLETLKKLLPRRNDPPLGGGVTGPGLVQGQAHPASGRGLATIAYQIEWAGKKVLFPGRIPIKITPHSVAGFASEIARSKADSQDYLDSLEELRGIRPDLWLPATPMDGQNANLYDNDWERVIDENRDIARFILSRAKPD